MLELEDYRLSDLFEEVYEAAWRNTGTLPAIEGDEHGTTDDEGAPTPPEESMDDDVSEDIGYDEEYSDADNALYTPTGSSTFDNGEPTDLLLLGLARTHPEDGPSSVIRPETPNEPSPDSHQSALPTYLMGLPLMALSAAFAQGRRGSAPAHDDRALEDPTSHDTTEHEPPIDSSDSNNHPRRHSAPNLPTVVDIVAEYRAIIRDEWDRVFQGDTTHAPNPYYSANGWDREALLNYTRFPFRRPPDTD
jgi:hypothetical protein